MGSRIRTKLLKIFALALIPLAVLAVLSHYNQRSIYKATVRVSAVSRESALVSNLQQALDRAIMPSNDYIITGKKEYAIEYKKYSAEMERLLKEADSIHDGFDGADETVAEEKRILKGLKESWGNVKDISARIFSIQKPVGNREAAELMEEMDYKWGANAIALLARWHRIDELESAEAFLKAEAAWRNVWIIMGGGVAAIALLTMYFAYYYSGVFVEPIERLREHSLRVASGDFASKAGIRTGDELEDLSDAMDRMSSELSALYGELERKVEERTKELFDANMELKAGEERYRDLFNGTNDAIFVHPVPGEGEPMKFTDVNETACSRLGYSRKELLELSPYLIDAPGHEAGREAAIREIVQNGHAIFEMAHVAKDGRVIPVEISSRVFELKGAQMTLSIARDISERKRGEDLLKEQIAELELFRKLTLKRELRLRELKDRIDALERELKGARA
ncbi:MAG: PAS domain S-box protein [Deltaproteobacteria bacterium]|nr:PAS domain S-box protein [Deltaproteobacteria bacterium]